MTRRFSLAAGLSWTWIRDTGHQHHLSHLKAIVCFCWRLLAVCTVYQNSTYSLDTCIVCSFLHPWFEWFRPCKQSERRVLFLRHYTLKFTKCPMGWFCGGLSNGIFSLFVLVYPASGLYCPLGFCWTCFHSFIDLFSRLVWNVWDPPMVHGIFILYLYIVSVP